MKNTFKAALLITTVMTPALAMAEDTIVETSETIIVEGNAIFAPQTQVIEMGDDTGVPTADGGEFLRNIPGVNGSRIGGHGMDPVIRGLQGNQLNIVNDGAMTFGGCPNRMDPPTAFVAPETFDEVVVTQGYQSVTGAAGGPGGTIEFKRNAPAFKDGKNYNAAIGGGYETNGDVRDAYFDTSVGNEEVYLRAIGNKKEANNYVDGSDETVRSAFKEDSIDMTVGMDDIDNGTSLTLGFSNINVDDALFAGAGMDSPYSRNRAFKGDLVVPFQGDHELRVETYASYVDHLMDNYSLRDRTAAMAMRVDSDSDTYGGVIEVVKSPEDNPITFGISYQNVQRDATRFSGMMDSNVNTQHSNLWPGITQEQVGIYGEGHFGLSEKTKLVSGLRFDYFDNSSSRADESIVARAGRSAHDLYEMYYGDLEVNQDETHFGGLLRLEHDYSKSSGTWVGVSRSVRAADATELYIASDAGTGSWVGNPNLDSEKHNQLEAGFDTAFNLSGEEGAMKDLKTSFSVYGNYVQDYITRDTARGQDGILLNNGASVYRNVDAMLAGFTAAATYDLTRNWKIRTDMSYTYGGNLDDDRPLAQIAPLEGSLAIDYERETWSLGTSFQGAYKQTRVDADSASGSGLDAGKTSSWMTQDIYGDYKIAEGFSFQAGVANLWDNTYAQHLNRSNSFDAEQVQVNEPGRTIYMRLRASF